MLADGEGFAACVEQLAERARAAGAEAIAGMEARGFIFGAAAAMHLRLPFIPIRKPGKLPVATIGVDYDLEYGTDRLELDPSAITPGCNIVIVDDLIATGGTAKAALQLLRRAGARCDNAVFVIGLPDIGGMAALRNCGADTTTLIDYAGG